MSIRVAGEPGIEGTTAGLRGVWEATSFQLERLQCDPACVEQEASIVVDVVAVVSRPPLVLRSVDA